MCKPSGESNDHLRTIAPMLVISSQWCFLVWLTWVMPNGVFGSLEGGESKG